MIRAADKVAVVLSGGHMKFSLLFLLVSVFLQSTALASFFDRPDYFENKAIYDEVEEIIELLYDDALTEKERELRLMFKDKKLVPTFKALKIENERRLVEHLKIDGKFTDEHIQALMKERPVIDAFKVTMENDFLGGTDIYYTNGLRVELSFNNPEFEKFFKKLGYDLSDFFLLCSQNIYNTSNNDDGSLRPNEPPNAGVLHCGGAVNSYKMDKTKARLRSMQRIEATLGAIGKYSFAQQVQNGFHRIIGDKEVNWDYQLADRFFVNVGFQKHIKIGEGDLYGNSEPEYNVIINAGGNAGSFTNFVNAGIMINYRLLGTLIDMYVGNKMTPSLIEELAMMSLESRLKRIICGSSNWSLNLFFGADARYVFNNNRLDGSLQHFTESEPLIIDLKAGVVVRYRKVFFELGMVRRSSEWNSTNGSRDAAPHTYGMASLTVRYDNFKELGANVAHPVRWMVDPEYRKKILEENRIRQLIAKEGLKVIYDSGDPKNPKKTFNITCQK
jgi:hypothetical protein